MASTYSPGGWWQRADLSMAGLGLVSGILSVSWGTSREVGTAWLEPVALVFGLAPELLPIGLFFGAVVGLSVWRWTGRPLAVPVVMRRSACSAGNAASHAARCAGGRSRATSSSGLSRLH
jgi:hypothetical protein